MNPVHTTLEPMKKLANLLGIEIGFISEVTPDRSCWYGWIPSRQAKQFIYQQIKHCEMAWRVITNNQAGAYLVYEFKTAYSLPLLAALLLRRRPSFLVMHGTQQLSTQTLLHRIGFWFTKWFVNHFNGCAVLFERGDDCLPEWQRFKAGKTIVMPLPHPLAECDGDLQRKSIEIANEKKIRIGVIGMLREEKGTQGLLNQLVLKLPHWDGKVELLLGTPFWQKQAWVDSLPITTLDTSHSFQYEAFFKEVDIAVFAYRQSDYYYRPSGVICDALMHGCYVVCPDFPIFRSQISNPVMLGVPYVDATNLLDAVESAFDELKRVRKADFDQWRNFRKIDHWAYKFRPFLINRPKRV